MINGRGVVSEVVAATTARGAQVQDIASSIIERPCSM